MMVYTHRDLSRTGNGDHVVPLSEEPGQGYLASCGIVPLADLLQTIGDLEDVGEVLFGESKNTQLGHRRRTRTVTPYRGKFRLLSSGAKSSGLFCGVVLGRQDLRGIWGMGLTNLPDSIPRPRGEYATTATPSSLAAVSSPTASLSTMSSNAEYSTSTALMGWTAYALRRVSPLQSDRPMYLTLPSLFSNDVISQNSTMNMTEPLLDKFRHGSDGFLDGDIGVWTVQVVQIDAVGPETFQRALYGFLDILRRPIEGRTVRVEYESTLSRQENPVPLAGAFEPK